MKKTKLFGVFVAAITLAVIGFVPTAQADPADDVAIMVENLPATVDAIVAGAQNAGDTFAETQSAQATVADLGQAVVDGGSELVAGTEQFGALGLGFMLLNGSTQAALAPYLEAIDDPATAGDLVNPDDVTTILDNLQPALDAAQPEIVNGLVALLEGDLFNAVLGAAGGAVIGPAMLVEGTNYSDLPQPLLIVVLVGVLAGGEYLNDLSEELAPVFEAAAPVTEEVIALLQGV